MYEFTDRVRSRNKYFTSHQRYPGAPLPSHFLILDTFFFFVSVCADCFILQSWDVQLGYLQLQISADVGRRRNVKIIHLLVHTCILITKIINGTILVSNSKFNLIEWAREC
jgi:hypothetical protein